ncbi:MAG: hypothetical protein VX470_00250, partial [Planctomycetota bacterium]|nr:hypothetical protein [Planctomycetota bacterium]
MALQIHGMGAVVPNGKILQETAARIGCAIGSRTATNARTVTALYRRSGVKQRHSVVLDNADTQESSITIRRPSMLEDPGAETSFFPP